MSAFTDHAKLMIPATEIEIAELLEVVSETAGAKWAQILRRLCFHRDCLIEKLKNNPEDNPEFDATDAAHPAWWRGHSHAVIVICQEINEILDGQQDKSGVSQEPWESTRKRLYELAKRMDPHGKSQQSGQETVH